MSINILTASGLVKLSGDKVTKDSIISALGYVPADEEILPNIIEDDSGELCITDESGNVVLKVNADGLSTTEVSVNGILLGDTVAGHAAVIEELTDVTRQHTSDTDIHITSEERELWNDKDYNNLENKPNITENDSDSLQITDNNGNVIMQVDAEGLETTKVTAQSVAVAGQDVGEHLADTIIHITAEEHTLWETNSHNHDNKELLDNYTGSYNDLTDRPIVDDEDGSNNLQVVDDEGYVIMQVNAEGLETTGVKAQTVAVAGQDVGEHLADTDIHITPEERTLWNDNTHNHDNKELLDVYTGSYNDLTDRPIVDDGSDALELADSSGNIIMKVDANGLETTNVIANTITSSAISIDGVDVETKLNTIDSTISVHIDESDNRTDKLHITDEERTTWNAKSEFSGSYNDLTDVPTDLATESYVAEQVAALVDSSPEALNTLNELAAALGDDPNFATTVAEQIGLKADQTALTSHADNQSNPHNVTATQIGLGNVDNTSDVDKPVSAAQQAALNALKSELSESIVAESSEWTIVDNSGNIIARVDADGLTTTDIAAQSVVVNEIDVETALNNINSNIANITSGTTVVKKAEHAENADEATHAVSADNATKATQDASGNVITSTYETKTDATTKLNTAKSYADGLIEALDVSDTAVSGQYITAVSEANGKISVSRTNLPDYSSTYAPILHTHTITANASDDDVIVVTGTSGINEVTYSASHANSGVTAGTYKSVTVNAKGHVTAGTNPTTLSGYGITDAVLQTNFDSHTSNQSNPHNVTKSQVGLENVDNTSDVNKPVSAAQQAALDNLKSELSESIVAESSEWTIVDEDDNIIAKVNENGLVTTTVTAQSVVVNEIDVEAALKDINSNIANITTSVAPAIQYGTDEVVDGAESPYPEGTLYVVIE